MKKNVKNYKKQAIEAGRLPENEISTQIKAYEDQKELRMEKERESLQNICGDFYLNMFTECANNTFTYLSLDDTMLDEYFYTRGQSFYLRIYKQSIKINRIAGEETPKTTIIQIKNNSEKICNIGQCNNRNVKGARVRNCTITIANKNGLPVITAFEIISIDETT